MKKRIIAVVSVCIILLTFILCISLIPHKQLVTNYAIVVESPSENAVGGTSVLIYGFLEEYQPGLIHASSSAKKLKIVNENNKRLTPEAIKPGDLIEVTFDGYIAESYPRQLYSVKKIEILGAAPHYLNEMAQEEYKAYKS